LHVMKLHSFPPPLLICMLNTSNCILCTCTHVDFFKINIIVSSKQSWGWHGVKNRLVKKCFFSPSVRSKRSPQSAKFECMFHCARWFPCPLLGLLSRLISWKLSKPFIWDIGKETRFFIYLWQIRRVRKRMLLYTITHGMNTSSLRMIDLRRCCSST
jgi:hypothetical protein